MEILRPHRSAPPLSLREQVAGVLAHARPRIVRTGAACERAARTYSWAWIGVSGVLALALVLEGAVGAFGSLGSLVPADTAPPPPPVESSRVFDVKGRLIGRFHGEENRTVVAGERIPRVVRDAVIAIEDQRFYSHGGVDGASMLRALIANMTEGDVVQGGSTITQQYVRNAYADVGRERTIARKAREALLAMRVEETLKKEEILVSYLNRIYLGRGAYGIQAGANHYFDKDVEDLELHEAAFLAGVIQAPETYAANATAAKKRRNLVLRRMAEAGFVSGREARAAARKQLGITRSGGRVQAAYFMEYVRRVLKAPATAGGFGLTDEELLNGGLRIETTLDLDAQKAAERAVSRVLNRKKDPEAALVAMTTEGEVRALVGGRNYTSIARARGFNYATQRSSGAGRSAGSVFKPFTLIGFLRKGHSPYSSFSAPSRITIRDRECSGPKGAWNPANYGNQGFGGMNVIQATEKSTNTVYAQMIARIGPRAALRAARDAGITSPLEPVCSLALGTFGVTPLEMTRAYATLGARGLRPEVLAVKRVVARDGTVVAERRPRSVRTIERRVADMTNKILEGVVQRGTGTPARIGRPAAGKTGTTEQRRDVWFGGYTPKPGLAAVVWIGYPPDKKGRIRPMRTLHGVPATGGGFAGRVWKYFMQKALRDVPEADFADVRLSGRRVSGTGWYSGFRRYSSTPRPQARTENRESDKPRRKRETKKPTRTVSEPTPDPVETEEAPAPEPSPEPSVEPTG